MDLVGGIALSRVSGKRQRGEKVETAEVKSEWNQRSTTCF